MRNVGQILKEAREEKLYSLEDVEKETRIRKELLIALEANDYTKLPPPTFVQGFIKNYAQFLGLNPKMLLAIYRREFSTERHKPYVMDAFSKPVEKKTLKITPSRILGLVVGLMVLTFFTYLYFQYRQFIGPPPLELTSPVDQITVDNPQITVEGKTEPELKVTVNNQEIKVDEVGNFKQEITLSDTTNKIEVIVSTRFGAATKIERTVYVKTND